MTGFPMTLERLCQFIGDGDERKGRAFLVCFLLRLDHARAEHPAFAVGAPHALGVIESEMRELVYAVEHESPERQCDEALDCVVVNTRFWLGEHLAHENQGVIGPCPAGPCQEGAGEVALASPDFGRE